MTGRDPAPGPATDTLGARWAALPGWARETVRVVLVLLACVVLALVLGTPVDEFYRYALVVIVVFAVGGTAGRAVRSRWRRRGRGRS